MGKHAIIVIKDNDKYLQYMDSRWNSKLFPNCKLDDTNNDETVLNHVCNILNLTKDNIELNLVGEKKHKKFSESDKIEKEYIHDFYLVKINKEYTLPENYTFMTYDELLNDERIMEVNSDIVGFIKEFNM